MRRRLTDRFSRQIARRTLDAHWDFMRRLAREGVVHVCLWNKYRQLEQRNEWRLSLMGGMELMEFIRQNRTWFAYGAHDHKKHTFPIWLTSAGRRALRTDADKTSIVLGGLVEPGYQVMPIDFHRGLNEQRARVREAAGLSPPTYIRQLQVKLDRESIFTKSGRIRRPRLRKAA